MRHTVNMSAMEPKPCGKKPIMAPDHARLMAESDRRQDAFWAALPKPKDCTVPMATYNRMED